MSASDIITTILSHALSVVIVSLRYSIISLEYSLKKYPEVTTGALFLVGLYITYRLAKRIVRMWINFVVSLVKITLFMVFVIFLALVYVRGSKLFTQDLSYIQSFFSTGRGSIFEGDETLSDYFDSLVRGGYSIVNGGIWSGLTGIWSGLTGGPYQVKFGDNEYIEVDRDTIRQATNYAQQFFQDERVAAAVSEGIDSLKGSGIDVQNILHNFLGNNRN